MNLLILPCSDNQSNNTAQWLQFAGIIVGIIVFIGNILWQKSIRDKDILERLNNEIFAACEKVIRTAYHSNISILSARYHYALYKLGEDTEHQERFYFKFYDEGQAANVQVKMYQIDLVKTIQDYREYGRPKDYNEISRLIKEKSEDYANPWACFTTKMSKEEIIKEYALQSGNISKFLFERTMCKNLRDIERIVHPDYPLWEQLDSSNKSKAS